MNSFAHHPSAEMLSALHDGQTGGAGVLEPAATHVGAHVATCEECAVEMRRLATMSKLLVSNSPALSQISRARLHQQIDLLIDGSADSSLIRFGIRISGIAASVLLVGSIWLAVSGDQGRVQGLVPGLAAGGVSSQSAPPWVGVAITSDADTVVRDASTPAAAIYLADASSSEAN